MMESDQAVSVRLADGTEHRADVIISAADGRTTIFDMLDGKYVDDKIRSYYDEWPIYQPIIQISLGIARDFSREIHSVIYSLEEPIKVGDETRRWLHLQQHCYDPTMAPPGKSMLTVSFMNNNHPYWKKLYGGRERYKAEKKSLADAVIYRRSVFLVPGGKWKLWT